MMGLPTQVANGNHKNRNDLTQIRGIGAIRKRWLHSLGVYTIADLAQASVDAIEAQSKDDARILSRDELEGWDYSSPIGSSISGASRRVGSSV